MSTPLRRRLGMAGLWLVVVVACASLTWLVIERAGRNVGVTQVALPAVQTSAANEGLPPRASGPSPTPSPARPRSEPEPGPATPTLQPGIGPFTEPPSTPSGEGTPSVPAQAAERATFTTTGGTVTVVCTGSAIRLDSATPRDGYRLHEEGDSGELEVSFTSGYGSGEAGGQGSEDESVELRLVCQDGVPVEHH